MNVNYAIPFVDAAIITFSRELNADLKRHSLIAKNSPLPSLPISIVIGVTGMVKGQIVYSLDNNTATSITRCMIPHKLLNELPKYVNSAISELANIITGQAGIKLADCGLSIEITPPSVLMGNISMDFLTIPTLCLNMISIFGSMEINIALTA